MFEIIVASLYFFLPAFVANSVPVYAKRFNWFSGYDIPVDGGKKWHNKRILGDHKTVRGFLVGIIASLITGLVLFLLYSNSEWIRSISLFKHYDNLTITLFFASAQGLGALVGDSLKSFFKRQVGIPSGKPWVGPDQIDYILGGIIFSLPFFQINWKIFIILLLGGTLLHFISNVFLKITGVRKEWL